MKISGSQFFHISHTTFIHVYLENWLLQKQINDRFGNSGQIRINWLAYTPVIYSLYESSCIIPVFFSVVSACLCVYVCMYTCSCKICSCRGISLYKMSCENLMYYLGSLNVIQFDLLFIFSFLSLKFAKQHLLNLVTYNNNHSFSSLQTGNLGWAQLGGSFGNCPSGKLSSYWLGPAGLWKAWLKVLQTRTFLHVIACCPAG